MNPWNGVCENTDIIVYILYKGRPRPICRRCWEEIAEKDFEWEPAGFSYAEPSVSEEN